MSFNHYEPDPDRFELENGLQIVLRQDGFEHPTSARWKRTAFTRYDEITHIAGGSRSVRVGAKRSVYMFARSAFSDGAQADELARVLLARIAERPGGSEQLGRMAQIEHFARQAPRPRVTRALALVCFVVLLLQIFLDPLIHESGFFSATLVRAGEWWRLFTANLLHALPRFPIHFMLNVLGLLVLGALVEWTLGAARTALIMAASALGAMGAGLVVNYEDAVGASGIVMGVFGALVFLEFRYPEYIPAHWRLPRSLIWLGIGLQFGIEFLAWLFFPVIATGAHLGGFAAGFLTAALLARPQLRLAPVRFLLMLANTLAALAVLASIGAAGALAVRGTDDVYARRGSRMLLHAVVSPLELNNTAWMLATAEGATSEHLRIARQLAEKAVEATLRKEPHILDTLAEVQFRQGEVEVAIATIEEAILILPEERYFQEQRQRFRGERPDELPEPPDWNPGAPREPTEPEVPDVPELSI